MNDGKHALLDQLEGLYVAQGLPTRRTPPTADMPAETLWVIFEGFGRDDVPLDLGFSFLPLPPSARLSMRSGSSGSRAWTIRFGY